MRVEEAYRQFARGVEAGRIAHAYIIVGSPRAEGGELATRMLQGLLCEAADGGEPCGRCPNCVRVAGRKHPDVNWLEPQRKSRIISIDQVRELQGRVFQTSFLGGWKACVLLSADRLGPEASNAFLKTLEEPPGRSLFLLVTGNPGDLLPTIRSRCQQIALEPGSARLPGELEGRVLAVLAQEAGTYTERLARGGRLAAVLKDLQAAAESAEAENAKASDADEEKETLEARAAALYREFRADVMRLLTLWYRDVLLLVCDGSPDLLYFGDRRDELRRIAGRLRYRHAWRNVRTVEEMARLMEQNLRDTAVLEWGFCRLS